MLMTQYLASLRLLAGDEAGFRDLCAEVISEFKEPLDPDAGDKFARACVLAPHAVHDFSAVVQMAERAVASRPRIAWYLFGLGAAHYRLGQPREAIGRLEESLKAHPAWAGRGQNYVVLAMACHQLGRHDEAREWLKQAKASLDELDQSMGKGRFGYAGSSYLGDWLALLILIPEAEKLVPSGPEG
jgi:tetratricopeptide (TPR) repeat protein